MIECLNVEMRDQLPDLANDTLEPSARALVLAHLSECAGCTAEIEILRTTRLIMLKTTPKVNVAGIVSALPQYGVTSIADAPGGSLRRGRTGWTNSWRAAAAVTFLAAGLGSYELLNKDAPITSVDSIAAVSGDSTVGLALTGALADLSDAELGALATEVEKIEALPSTEIETMTSRVSVPAILPDSVVKQLEDR
jgi:hypothetical protein